MGHIDFVKEAGERIFQRDEFEAGDNAALAQSLAQQVGYLGLSVKDLQVQYKNGTATLKGAVATQAEREKIVLVVGNTQGVGRVDDRLTVDKKEPEATYYTVKAGDNLGKIAKTYYNNAMKHPVIFEANRPMLNDPNHIYPGQVLRIPPLQD